MSTQQDGKKTGHDDTTTEKVAEAAASETNEQIDALEQELEEYKKYKEIAARSQAELQNAKDRLARETSELRMYAAEGMIRKLLPTLDNFERAFAHIPEELKNHEFIKGISAVEKDLVRVMKEAGLKRMESLNQPIDPQKHEVLMQGDGPDNTVIEVFEEGYELHDRILRAAKVKAGNGSAS